VGRSFYVLRCGTQEHRLLPGAFTLGRSSECNLCIEDPRASRVHALIRSDDESAVLQDAGSSNGTLVNGVRLQRAQPLQQGDAIQIGDTVLTVHRVEQISAGHRGRRSRDETLPSSVAAPVQRVSEVDPGRLAGPLSELSPRELEVLQLVARGYTHKEIAEQLELSPKTVEGYRARISEKLGLKSRAELVELALHHKLLG
jgi:pSer/pThr/pTyr-binding forkhead associated (FHA) protein